MIKAVLFDFGGTLVRPRKPWSKIREHALRATYKFLRKSGLEKTLREYVKMNAKVFKKYAEIEASEGRDIPDELKYRELMDHLFPSLIGRERARLAAEANDIFWRMVAKAHNPSIHVHSCLARLRSMGLRMAVVSNHHNHKALDMMLKLFKLRGYFKVVIASESVGVRKPNPKIFRLCLTGLGLSRSKAIFVGDSLPYDVEGAKAAGITAVLYVEDDPVELRSPRDRDGVESTLDPGVEPDFILGDLASLPRVIEILNKKPIQGALPRTLLSGSA